MPHRHRSPGLSWTGRPIESNRLRPHRAVVAARGCQVSNPTPAPAGSSPGCRARDATHASRRWARRSARRPRGIGPHPSFEGALHSAGTAREPPGARLRRDGSRRRPHARHGGARRLRPRLRGGAVRAALERAGERGPPGDRPRLLAAHDRRATRRRRLRLRAGAGRTTDRLAETPIAPGRQAHLAARRRGGQGGHRLRTGRHHALRFPAPMARDRRCDRGDARPSRHRRRRPRREPASRRARPDRCDQRPGRRCHGRGGPCRTEPARLRNRPRRPPTTEAG